MSERRNISRKKSFLKGTVYFNNRLSSLACVVRDFSDTGARLEFAAVATVPDNVELYVPARDQTLRCEVRWRRGNEIGVNFETDGAAEGSVTASTDLAKRLQSLEQEVAKLQRQFQEFRADLRHKRGED
jgi:hypothetical protein